MNIARRLATLAGSSGLAGFVGFAGLVALAGCGDLDVAARHPVRLTIASRPIFAPLGISTGGYNQTPDKSSPQSPFAENFQATTTLYHQPRVQVFRLRSGANEVIFAQTDLIGIHQNLWRLVTRRVLERTGEDVTNRLILMANHTHSGPGHIFDAFFAAQVVDKFEAEIADRVASDIAAAIAESLSTGDSIAVKVGWTTLQNDELHRDRRCENPDLRDDTMGVLGFESLDGKLVALMVNYAMHGTVFSADDGMLSGDSAGAVEVALEDATGAAVMFTQSWAGDMSPGHPKAHYADGLAHKASVKGLDQLESLGRSAQLSLAKIASKLKWMDAPAIAVRSAEIPINRAILQYEPGTFAYEHGAILCGFGASACDGKTANMKACIPVPNGGGPAQIRLTSAQIGEVALATLPGEPLTELGTRVTHAIAAAHDTVNAAFLLGYAQDYTGYLLMPDDWWAGGYEGGFNYWGPRQGVYLADAATALMAAMIDGKPTPWTEPPRLKYELPAGPSYAEIAAQKPGEVVTKPPADNPMTGEVLVEVNGFDPVRGAPSAVVLDTSTGAVLQQVSTSQIVRTLRVEPSFVDAPVKFGQTSSARQFIWGFRVRTRLATPGLGAELHGALKLRIHGVTAGSSSVEVPFFVE